MRRRCVLCSVAQPHVAQLITCQHCCFGTHAERLHSQVQQQLQRLRQAVQKHSLKLKSPNEYVIARYNDPSTKPIFRRNEILVELEDFQLW
jgi:SOUL heme-binding protein